MREREKNVHCHHGWFGWHAGWRRNTYECTREDESTISGFFEARAPVNHKCM